MNIAETLRRLREGKGMTQTELAAASGVPQKTISNIEQGVSDNPAWKTMVLLAAALGVSTEAFRDPPPVASKRK